MKKIIALIVVLLLIFVQKNDVQGLSVSARSAVVVNADTLEILWSKNAEECLPMASTTKIMTALLLCESGRLDRSIVTTKEMVTVEGSSMGLLEGDSVTLRDLLYGLMLPSGNDAANTVALVLGGSIEGFADMMNARAQQLGLSNTHFVTPSGLDSDGHYTTAYDLARLAAAALKNPDFAAAAGAESVTLSYGNPPYRRTLTNHNKLLKMYDDVIGVKTGFTKKSGRCLVSAAEKEGKRIIAVTLNAPDDWRDHRALLDFGLSAVKSVAVAPQIDKTPAAIGAGERLLLNVPDKSFCVSLDAQIGCDAYICPIVFAPIESGEVMGKVVFYNDSEILHIENITSKNQIPAREITMKQKMLALLKIMLTALIY